MRGGTLMATAGGRSIVASRQVVKTLGGWAKLKGAIKSNTQLAYDRIRRAFNRLEYSRRRAAYMGK